MICGLDASGKLQGGKASFDVNYAVIWAKSIFIYPNDFHQIFFEDN